MYRVSLPCKCKVPCCCCLSAGWCRADGSLQRDPCLLCYLGLHQKEDQFTQIPSGHPQEGWVLQTVSVLSISSTSVSPWLHLLLGKCRSSVDQHERWGHRIVSSSRSYFAALMTFHQAAAWAVFCFFKLNIAANCIDANLNGTKKKKLLCILVPCRANVGHLKNKVHIWQVWSNQGLYSFLLSGTSCVWAPDWNCSGVCRESCFFFVSQQREHVRKETPAVLPVRLDFGCHFFPPACSTAVKPQTCRAILKDREENLYMIWKFAAWVRSETAAFQPNFYFSALMLAMQSSGSVAFTWRMTIITVIRLENSYAKTLRKLLCRITKSRCYNSC